MRGRPVKTPELVAAAQRLRAEGLTHGEIGERFGVANQTVHAWLSDPDGAKQRARKDSYRGTCIDCGAPTNGSAGPSKAPQRCQSCNGKVTGAAATARGRAKAEPRRQRIVAMWHEGCTLREIADALGTTPESIGVTVVKLRREGWDLPYRRGPEQVQNIREGVRAARVLWTRDLILEAIRDNTNGAPPSRNAMARACGGGMTDAAVREFGSWANAVDEAMR